MVWVLIKKPRREINEKVWEDVVKLDKLLRKERFLFKERSLTKEWGYYYLKSKRKI